MIFVLFLEGFDDQDTEIYFTTEQIISNFFKHYFIYHCDSELVM